MMTAEIEPRAPEDLALDKACADLEWGRIVRAVRERCRGPQQARLEAIVIERDFASAHGALSEAREAWLLEEQGDPLPLDGIRELGRSLERLERAGDLDGPELRAIAATLGAARALRRFLSRRRETCPELFRRCSTDPTLDDLQDELLRAVDADGTLSDTASPDLRSLRTEVANLRARIVARLEHLLLKHADIVQDRFHTVREGRYVLPIRTDAHEKMPGIVHGTSGSGASIFVEPKAIITQGNRLKMAQAQLEREEARILGILSGRVRDRVAEVNAAVEALDRADLRGAAVRLCRDLRGTFPELERASVLELQGARHPLLALDGVEVVDNDLSLEAGKGLIFSGPNAGGKTVALKVLGLAALMARAGLPVPAREGSRVGFFGTVLTDVGDDQSIEKNLSTFSAHVTNLARVLEHAGPTALVLLDELATGTDPEEGSALALAVVEGLLDAGAAAAVTTHYERLKAAALSDPRFRNASVGFSVERMEPTFRVRPDVPGSSSALAVARRFGMPESVIASAEARLPEESRTFDALVRRLEERFEALESERAAAQAARKEAEAIRDKAQQELEKARARDKKKLTQEGEKLMAQLREVRAQLKTARSELKKQSRDAGALTAVRKQLASAAEQLQEAAPSRTLEPEERGSRVSASSLSIGDRVWVPRLRTEVDVVDAPSRGRLRVAAGPVKLWVRVDEVRSLNDKAPPPREDTPPPSPKASASLPGPNSGNTVDVRGMRVDDALSMTEAFLDRMFGDAQPVAYVLHGVGTGALRDAVREHLPAHLTQYVASVRPATLEEGGARMTVVTLC
ncbi:MAG: endonuclease MutS2 [Sandaracinaceae bacterium]